VPGVSFEAERWCAGVEPIARPGPRPGPSPARGDALARVREADELLEALVPVDGPGDADARTLREHVEAFDAVHRALQDALAPTEG
jgi:hypothetical protein